MSNTFFAQGSFSRVFLVGTVGADSKSFVSKKDSKTYTALTVVTSRGYTDKNGAQQTTSTRTTVYVEGEQKYQVGAAVSVCGRLGTQVAFPKSDTNKYSISQCAVRDPQVEVIADVVAEGFGGSNSVILEGRMQREAREITAGNGGCSFELAVSTKTAEGEEKTDWIPVTIWGKKSQNFLTIVHPGDLVKLTGSLNNVTRKVGDIEKVLLNFVADDFIVDARKKAATEPAEKAEVVVDEEASELPY